jgi:hypothetical protein
MRESIYRVKKFIFCTLAASVHSKVIYCFFGLSQGKTSWKIHVSMKDPHLLPPVMKKKDMVSLGYQYPLQGKT